MDKEMPDLSHGADRDSHFLAASQVPSLEEHVSDLVAAGFHDQPLDLPYLAVGRTDGQVTAYVCPAGWDVVDGGLLRGFRSAKVAGNLSPEGSKRPLHLVRGVVWVPVPGGVEVPHALGRLGRPEPLELG